MRKAKSEINVARNPKSERNEDGKNGKGNPSGFQMHSPA